MRTPMTMTPTPSRRKPTLTESEPRDLAEVAVPEMEVEKLLLSLLPDHPPHQEEAVPEGQEPRGGREEHHSRREEVSALYYVLSHSR